MANKVFKLKNNRVITFIEDERHDFVVHVNEVSILFELEIHAIKNLIANAGMSYDSMIALRRGTTYFTGTGFVELESIIANSRNAGVVEQIMKWIGKNCQFDDLVLPDPDLVRADHGFNFLSEDVIDMCEWERGMLLLIVEVDNLDLRRKLVTKIKEVI